MIIAIGFEGGINIVREIVGILISGVIGGVRVGTLVSAMNTVHQKTTASAYMDKKSVVLGRREDNFLYSKTEKREKPKQQ